MMKVRSRILAAVSLCLVYLNFGSVASAGTLLPNGMQQFFSFDGTTPNAAGCVYFYTPGTLSAKATYQDAAQTIANTNPVQLDAAGRAIIYGTGTYRQIVKSTGPNAGTPCSPAGAQVWDQITASTDSSSTIFAGASAGTPNSITVTATAFSGADGQVINFISTNTNTGGATFNPSGFGAVQIVRDSATGPQALTGGELVATNAVSLIYDATAGTFHILSPVTWPNASGVPVGTVIVAAGFTAPTNYAFAYGQTISRTTFASLLSALTSAQSGSLSSGSPTITGLSDISQLGLGMPVESVGIPAGTTISSCTGTSCTMSANATATRTGTITFFAYGNGDGSTTFNLPDLRGRTMAGRDNMGGSAAGTLTATYYGASPTTLGKPGGTESKTLTLAQLPAITSTNASQSISVSPPGGRSIATTLNAIVTAGYNAGAAGNIASVPLGGSYSTDTAFSGTNTITVTSTGTSGTAHSVVQPSSIVNYAIRLTP